MDFGHYSAEAASFAAALVNTRDEFAARELVEGVEAWRSFLEPYVIEGSSGITPSDVEQIKEYRDRLRPVFTAGETAAIEELNDILRDVAATPQISSHDGHPWHMHYSAAGAPLAHRIASGAAMGLAVVIAEQGYDRLGVCDAHDCLDVYVDTSKNRSRRYCNQTCSTKMNVAAHRARHKEGSSP